MTILLLKISVLFAIALAAMPAMRRVSAAMRHLICVTVLAGSLLLPFSLLAPLPAAAFRISTNVIAGQAVRAISSASPDLITIWLVGVAALLVRIAVGLWQVSRIFRGATRLSAGIYEADLAVPVACGLLHPAIVLPRGSERWPASELEAAIRHERAHIERKDLWTNLIAHIACAVYWFHPLVWLVARELRRQQEMACDDAVICSGFDSGSYAEALVTAARSATSTTLFMGCPMLQIRTLRLRVARLLDANVARVTSSASLLRAAVLVTAVLVAIGIAQPVIAQDQPHKVGQGVSAPQVVMKVEPEYTDAARNAKISGTVLLRVVVGAEGLARDIVVVKGLDPGLDANAIKAVQSWRFQPGMLNGSPVAVTAQIEINFRLLDDPPQ